MRCTECSPAIREKLLTNCNDCGEEWIREDYEMSLVGNNVIALFPNIQSRSTGKIVRDEVERSPLVIEGFDYKLGTKYIVMNKQYTGNLKPIANLLPWRKKVTGVTPGMKNRWVNSKKDEEKDEQWCYPKATPTDTQKRQIVSRVAEIGTRFLFQNFTYKFGGEMFQQMSGGPIGARITMCAARLVMQSWARSYSAVLLRSGLRLPYHAGFRG